MNQGPEARSLLILSSKVLTVTVLLSGIKLFKPKC